jgi:hypothetical protein
VRAAPDAGRAAARFAAATRRRSRLRSGAAAATSASQYGQIFQRGSSGFAQTAHGSLSRRRQLGQRRKDFSISNPQ